MKINDRLSIFCFLCLILLLVNGCDTFGGKKVQYPSDVDSKMEAAFNEAEHAYDRHDYDRANELYLNYINAYPYNKLSDESIYKIGKICFIRKNWGGVLDQMSHLIDRSPDPMYRAKAGLMGAYAAYKNTDYQGAMKWLEQTKDGDLPDKLKLRYFSLYALSAQQLSMPREKSDYAYLRLADIYQSNTDASLGEVNVEDIVRMSDVDQKIDSWIISPMTVDQIPSWVSNYPNGYSRGFVEYKWGKIFYEAQMTDKAKKKLTQFVNSYPKNKYVSSARKLLENLGLTVPNESKGDKHTLKVGVLLPMTGAKALYGESALKGIRCASGQESMCGENIVGKFREASPVELVVKDSGNTPEAVSLQIEELAAQNVSAIIGPMSASLAEAAATKAQSLRVPVFPITQKTDLMKAGEYVFQMGFEVSTQMSLLVREARNKGLKTFAVFYPGNSYGQEMMQGFVKAVEASGGKVVSKVSYNPESPELTEFAHQLKTGVSRITLGTNDMGFQAVFVPDSFSALGRIIPAFETNGIRGLPLLGTTAWNDPRLPVDQLIKYPGSFYVDLFNPSSSSGMVSGFVAAMRALSGRTPTSMEALGFDALWAIRSAAFQKGSNDSSKVRDGLEEIYSLDGVTGIKSFKVRQGPVVEPFTLSSATN